jgi:hypothetical protein
MKERGKNYVMWAVLHFPVTVGGRTGIYACTTIRDIIIIIIIAHPTCNYWCFLKGKTSYKSIYIPFLVPRTSLRFSISEKIERKLFHFHD